MPLSRRWCSADSAIRYSLAASYPYAGDGGAMQAEMASMESSKSGEAECGEKDDL
jgi:hypothetical protein